MARILIIDDDEALRGTMRKILEMDGHRIQEAQDGEVGLRLFRESPVDLVVTDILMPEKEGIETILELRELSPDLRILAVSGGMELDRTGPLADAEALGADSSLPKPFSVDELQEAVRSLLER